jgi:hypothetical protein
MTMIRGRFSSRFSSRNAGSTSLTEIIRELTAPGTVQTPVVIEFPSSRIPHFRELGNSLTSSSLGPPALLGSRDQGARPKKKKIGGSILRAGVRSVSDEQCSRLLPKKGYRGVRNMFERGRRPPGASKCVRLHTICRARAFHALISGILKGF